MLIKNISASPRGVYSKVGKIVVVQPGETKEVILSDATAALVRKSPSWKVVEDAPVLTVEGTDPDALISGEVVAAVAQAIGGASEDDDQSGGAAQGEQGGDGDSSEDDPGPETSLEALREQAEELGIKVDKRWGAERLNQEIENALRETDSGEAEGETPSV